MSLYVVDCHPEQRLRSVLSSLEREGDEEIKRRL